MPEYKSDKSPDFLFSGWPLEGRLDEEGIGDIETTDNNVRQTVQDLTGVEVKDPNTKALAEAFPDYPEVTYSNFSDKRFREETENA